jgi:hypothetical protein
LLVELDDRHRRCIQHRLQFVVALVKLRFALVAFELVGEPLDEQFDQRPLELGERTIPDGRIRETDRAVQGAVHDHFAADVTVEAESLVGRITFPALRLRVIDPQ